MPINNEILSYILFNNTVKSYLISLIIFISSIIILKIFKFIIIKKLRELATKTKTEFDDLLIKIVDHIGWPFYVLLSLYISIKFITIPELLQKISNYVIIIVLTYYIIKAISSIIDFASHKIITKKQETEDTSLIDLLTRILKGIIWAIAIIMIIQNLGYNVSGLMAGLGIGGIAIAFALQNVLGDVFASFSIYFDKPFQVGDFIIVGNEMGTVKKIGIKSTRLQTLQGQELIISNKELTETRVHNYKRMDKRRIVFNIGVTYNTSTKKLKKIPEIIKKIIDDIELTELNRVHFQKFGDYSLIFEIVYYVSNREYNVYMDIQQEINLKIKEAFEKEKIDIAYPTQTVVVNK